mmetsp:Transcript_1810/g.2168  ORF Transcript_1810/g.2168 Transcript_1810/m.2168 type:complete len:205 (+) Transcript_1810:218-832(+)
MSTKITNKIKMFLKPRLLEHVVRITTDGENLSSLHVVMVVQGPPTLKPWNGPFIYHSLSIILTHGVKFGIIEFEQAVGGRIKFQIPRSRLCNSILHGLIINGNHRVIDEARIDETTFLCKVVKVVPVQRATETFTPEHFIVPQLLCNASIGIYVGKIQFASRFEDSVTGFEYCLLIGAEVDDTVGDDDIDGIILQFGDFVQFLD